MPASYRFEISPNNRAGCQNKECKDAGLKVKKGELRFGTWVEFNFGERDIQGWKWRHWSCITPTVIQNLLNALGGLEGIEDDLNVIDGYDEIPREWQEKILTMLREGHVPDEDWKGDVEQNRPGKRGSHKKAKATKKRAGSDGEHDNAEGTPTKAKATKGRGKKVKNEDNGDDEVDDAEGMTKGKATKGRGKKIKTEANGDDEGDELEAETAAIQKKNTQQKKRKSGHLALMEAGNNDEAGPEEELPKKSRAKKIKVEKTPEGQMIEPKNNGPDARPSRIAKNAREKKTDALKKDDSNVLVEAESSPKDRKKAVKVEQLDGTADFKIEPVVKTEPETVTKPPVKRGRQRKAVKAKDVEKDAEKDTETMAGASAGPEAKTQEVPEAEGGTKPKARKRRANTGVEVEDEDEEVEDMADVPAEAEQEAAPVPDKGSETKLKAKAGRKKGLAKPIPRGRIRPDY